MFKNIFKIFSKTKVKYKKAIFCEFFHSFLIAIPNWVLLFILWELFAENPNKQKIIFLLLIMIISFIIQLFLAKNLNVIINKVIFTMTSKIRIMLWNHLQKLSLWFYKKRDPWDIGSVIMQDVSNFEMIFSHSIQDLFWWIFSIFFLSLFLFFLDFKLTLIILFSIPVAMFVIFLAWFFLKKYWAIHIKSRNDTWAKFIEYIEWIVHLKAFNQTWNKFSSLKNLFLKLKKDSIKLEIFPWPFLISAFMVFEFSFLIMLYYAVLWLNSQTLSIPYFIAFLIIWYRIYEPMKLIIVQFAILRYMNVSLTRIIELLEAPLQTNWKNLIPEKYDIEFKNVFFWYSEENILEDISFKIKQNTMTALVWTSWVWKSTITNLISRFWDVKKWKITIWGINLKNISPANIYSIISVVFQEVYLFNDTILENIKIWKPNATENEIKNVIKNARIDEFLPNLKDWINTKVWEWWSYLSWWQKQRISIARAMLKNSPIILLDEATASLDPENEIYIQEAIEKLIENKTVVVIAHKLNTVSKADNIIVLWNKKIQENWKHKELLAKKWIYKNFWDIQQKISNWKII